MFGKEKMEMDKFFVYKRMEDLNNLENKFHQDKDEKMVSDTKFNFKFYNSKRQLYLIYVYFAYFVYFVYFVYF